MYGFIVVYVQKKEREEYEVADESLELRRYYLVSMFHVTRFQRTAYRQKCEYTKIYTKQRRDIR